MAIFLSISRTMRASPLDAQSAGYLYGFLGVLCFSFTLPATRLAVAELDPITVGLGRSVVAGVLAIIVLLATKTPAPERRHWRGLLVVSAGVVFGFPLFSAWAMQSVPASHGAVVVGILPLATAIVGALRFGERQPPLFWIAGGLGSLAVVIFSAGRGGGHIHAADTALFLAMILAAFGYAEGGRMSRELGGWRVICWALVISLPVLVPVVGMTAWRHGLHASPAAWLGFGYVSCFSMFLGFFAWYHGLALGGIARVGQVQLLQPIMTMLASAWLLGEQVAPSAGITALVVISAVALGRFAASPGTTALGTRNV
jgi:drug/metabolite transporter (DMT)-like permease